jgi:hypothetical protein
LPGADLSRRESTGVGAHKNRWRLTCAGPLIPERSPHHFVGCSPRQGIEQDKVVDSEEGIQIVLDGLTVSDRSPAFKNSGHAQSPGRNGSVTALREGSTIARGAPASKRVRNAASSSLKCNRSSRNESRKLL